MPANWPVGLQFDGVYASYNRDDAEHLRTAGLTIMTGAASVVYQVELDASPIEPYFLLGVSINKLKVEDPRTIDNYGSATKFGIVLRWWRRLQERQRLRIAPLIDFRLLRHLRPDPREGAYINLNVGFLILLKGRHSAP